MASSHRPRSVTIALILIALNAAFWLVFAILAAVGAIRPLATIGMIRWVMVVAAVGASVTLVGIAVLMARRNRFGFYAALIVLAVLAVLSITDEVGWPDLLTFLVSLSALVLILKERAWFTRKNIPSPTPDQMISSKA